MFWRQHRRYALRFRRRLPMIGDFRVRETACDRHRPATGTSPDFGTVSTIESWNRLVSCDISTPPQRPQQPPWSVDLTPLGWVSMFFQ
jgi:hypothetical protein